MKYYHMQLKDALKAQERVWQTQDMLNMKHTPFNTFSYGTDTSLWTTSPVGEEYLRGVLGLLGVSYEESDSQYVRSWLDDMGLI